MDERKELMLYLHVPFCVRKCNYCDFLSFACTDETRSRYVDALCRELRERGREYSGRIVPSIFFGGGTPSLLSPAQLSKIMDCIRETFCVRADAEITMECNPGTVANLSQEQETEKLRGFRAAGINRLSIGLQSANDEELKLLGRIHDYQAFLKTYAIAREVGFTNVNVDLMNALPGQTLDTWKATLEKVLALKPMPEHLSVYSLIMEEGTQFAAWESQGKFEGKLQIPSEELDREMYAYTGTRLREAGFSQYEISNYAREGYACQHNVGYWIRKDYLGIGLGAASLIDGVRYSNGTSLEEYLKDPLAGREEEILTRSDQIEEFAFLGLRMNCGIRRADFETSFGEAWDGYWSEIIRKNVADGLLEEDAEGIRLTDRGRDLGNYVFSQFLFD
ncbi:MAG: radical SAM family heme chaperone HemW [Lachnospiraceae bacterium]|nr:radical SAM family heme chaperone HemW [Lachnospiraceae bacterium]